MTTLGAGDTLTLIGPLGNGFSVPGGKEIALLAAGGMGAPPLQHLAKHLREVYPGIKVVFFAGARSCDDMPFELVGGKISEFSGSDVQSYIATDDGSAGFGGLVTDCLGQWLREHDPPAGKVIVYSCGPEAMLAAVSKLCGNYNIDCQVSMERMMGCGIGLCQSCAVSTKSGYKLCCKDGPVFDSKDICF